MNSELFWQTQPFHINTGAPFTTFSHYHRCSLLWGYPWQWHVHNINIYTLLSTHSYLPNTEDIQVNFFDTRETCSMLHALVTINEESLVPQFLTLKLLFISFIGMSYRYLHQYKHNISRYLLEYQHGVGCRTHGPGLRRTSTAPPPEPELRSSRHSSHFYWQLPSVSDLSSKVIMHGQLGTKLWCQCAVKAVLKYDLSRACAHLWSRSVTPQYRSVQCSMVQCSTGHR